jgi:hypothetical protein
MPARLSVEATTTAIMTIVALSTYLKTLMAMGAQTPLDGAMIVEIVKLTASDLWRVWGRINGLDGRQAEAFATRSIARITCKNITRGDSVGDTKAERALVDHTALRKSQAPSFSSITTTYFLA